MRAIGRIIWVPLAFLLSAGVALLVLFYLGIERVTHVQAGRGAEPERIFELLDLLTEGVLLASAATVLPALALVLAGEVARIRSALYYVIGGGLSLAAIPLLSKASVAASAPVWQVFATAGFAGGLVYWLMAGRNA